LNSLDKKVYAFKAMSSDIKAMQFLGSSSVHNAIDNSITKIQPDMEWHHRQTYLYNTFLLDDLNYIAEESKMIPVFVTCTLPTQYHPFSKNEVNPKYNDSNTIEVGYKLLQEFSRSLTHDFFFNQKRVKLKYFRVCEPHKSFVPHFHLILWIPKGSVDAFHEHHKNTILLYKFNKRGQDKKVLDTAKYATTYILKYTQKTLEGVAYVRGWKQFHKIRLTASSRGSIPSSVFKKLSPLIPFDKDSNLPYLQQLKKKTLINVRVLDYDHNVLSSTMGEVSSSNEFAVSLDKLRTTHFRAVPISLYKGSFSKYIEADEPETYCVRTKKLLRHEHNDVHRNFILEKYYKYKIIDFSIIDLSTFETVYDSKDYTFLREGEYKNTSSESFNYPVGDNARFSERIIDYNNSSKYGVASSRVTNKKELSFSDLVSDLDDGSSDDFPIHDLLNNPFASFDAHVDGSMQYDGIGNVFDDEIYL